MGNLGWESGTFVTKDKSGTAVDTGKYVTVYRRQDGKWLIVRDTWNSDVPPPTPAVADSSPKK